MVLEDPALVLNRNWVPVDFTTVMDALCKLYTGAARAIHPDDYSLHDLNSWTQMKALDGQTLVRTATLSIPAPDVIVLSDFTGVPKRGLAFSRANLYKRDGYTCQYCGRKPGTSELTIDHIVPRSRGGLSSWSNCVVACIRCNSRKADLTLAESGLKLRSTPEKPKWAPRLILARVPMKTSWEKFVSETYWNVDLEA